MKRGTSHIVGLAGAVGLLTPICNAAPVTTHSQHRNALLWMLILSALLLLVIVAITILFVMMRRRRQTAIRTTIDSTTGIGNAYYLEQKCNAVVGGVTWDLYYFVYIGIDCQRYETYFGNAKTVELEQFSAFTISSELGQNEYVGRISDGIFAVCMQASDSEHAAERISKLLGHLNSHELSLLKERGNYFKAGYYHVSQRGQSYDKLLSNSKTAYIEALKQKSPYIEATEHLLNKEALHGRLRVKLSEAIEAEQFEMYLQPIFDIKKGRFAGAEVLSRWNHPGEGILSPAYYIDDMRALGLIDRHDYYMLDKACKLLQALEQENIDFFLSCNFTRSTISGNRFLKNFHEVVGKYNFSYDRLMIEITEDSLAVDEVTGFQNTLELKNEGFVIALDDLGSGFSSFRDLGDYPIDIVKLDRHVIVNSVTERGKALLLGLAQLAKFLDIRLLCEGVETDTENQNAIDAGCDFIQGFRYTKPSPSRDVIDDIYAHRDIYIK